MNSINAVTTKQQKTHALAQATGVNAQSSNKPIELKRKAQLHKIIINNNHQPDYLAINLYFDTLRSWYTPMKQHNKDGSFVLVQKLKTKGIYLNYSQLAQAHGCSAETIRRKLVKLEQLGLIQRSFKHKSTVTTKSYNQLIVYVWKQTPHFFNKYGVDRASVSTIKPQTNHKYIEDKHDIVFSANSSSDKQLVEQGGIHKLVGTKELIEPFLNKKDRSIKSNFSDSSFKKECLESSDSNISTKEQVATKELLAVKEVRQLSDFYPLTESEVGELQSASGREFNLNAMNEILKSMINKAVKCSFKSKKGFMSYMSKCFRYEKRDAASINNATFKIKSNQTTEEHQEQREEKYLTELEYSLQVSPEWHFKKKLAAVLERSKAYKLLTAYKSIEVKEGVAKITLTKQVELTKLDQELILDQVRATQGGIEEGEYLQIEEIEFTIPQKQYQSELKTNQPIKSIYPDTIWGKIRQAIASSLGRDGDSLDKSWISKLEAEINEESRAVILKAPSGFVKDWIENNYQKQINIAVQEYGFNLNSISC